MASGPSGDDGKNGSQAKVIRGAMIENLNRPAYLKLSVADKVVYSLLDSGAEITLIPTANSEGMQLEPYTRKVYAANGTEIHIRGVVEFCAYADGMPLQITGLVSDHVSDMILGLDFLCTQAAVWSFDKGAVTIGEVEHKLHARAARKCCRRVYLEMK